MGLRGGWDEVTDKKLCHQLLSVPPGEAHTHSCQRGAQQILRKVDEERE